MIPFARIPSFFYAYDERYDLVACSIAIQNYPAKFLARSLMYEFESTRPSKDISICKSDIHRETRCFNSTNPHKGYSHENVLCMARHHGACWCVYVFMEHLQNFTGNWANDLLILRTGASNHLLTHSSDQLVSLMVSREGGGGGAGNVCHQFVLGRCNYEHCRFSHDPSLLPGAGPVGGGSVGGRSSAPLQGNPDNFSGDWNCNRCFPLFWLLYFTSDGTRLSNW